MRNLVLIGLVCSLSSFNYGFAQQDKKVGFSASFGVGYFGSFSSGLYGEDTSVSFVNEPEKQSQVNLNGDIALRLDGYIFSFYMAVGLVDPTPYKQANYAEYNITIGTEFLKTRRFGLEGHAGLGIFKKEQVFANFDEPVSDSALGFPIRIKANFYLNKHFALGINPNFNINLISRSDVAGIAIIGQLEL